MSVTGFSGFEMDLLATGITVTPGLPARTGDTSSDSEKPDESAIFEVFLGLALVVPSPDAVIAAGPEGKTAPDDAPLAAAEQSGKPAMPAGNILPVALPTFGQTVLDPSISAEPGARVAMLPRALPRLPAQNPAETTISRPAAPTAPIASAALAAPVPKGRDVAGAAKIAELLDAAASGDTSSQTAEAARPGPVTAQALAAARLALPVVSVLSGRQRHSPDAAPEVDAPDLPVPATSRPAELAPPVQSPLSTATFRPEPARSAPVAILAEPVGEATPAPKGKTTPEAPTPAGTPVFAASEPLAPFTEARPAISPQPAAAQNASSLAPQEAAREFGDIMDRLVRAREADQSGVTHSTLSTRDFGAVAMQLRTVEGRLHVALSSSDPGFAPAVQAASAVGATGQQALSDSSSQAQQQWQGQSAQHSGQGQSATDSQSRRQSWERAAPDGAVGTAPQNGDDGAPSTGDPHGEPGGSIYA